MWVVRRVLWAIGGLVLLVAGGALLVAGCSLLYVFGPSGSVFRDSASISGAERALVVDGVRVNGGSQYQEALGVLSLGVRRDPASGQSGPLFIGVAPEGPLFDYLGSAPYDAVTDVTSRTSTVRQVPGSGTLAPPEEQTFWIASAVGEEPRFDWPAQAQRPGYRLVVMNADTSPGVSVILVPGFVSTTANPVGLAAAIVGSVLLVPAVWMLYRTFRRRRLPAHAGRGVAASTVPEAPALVGAPVGVPLEPPVGRALTPPVEQPPTSG